MKKTTLLIFALVALAISACKKDKDDDKDPAICSSAWATEVADEMNAISAAYMAYAADPTHQTCVALKDSYEDYLDALEQYSKCALWTPQQKAELQASINEAEDDIASLCDE